MERDQEWSVSLAGCGFRSVYLVGALSCLLERVPGLVHGAARICGASSGCLVAAALVVGIPLEELCADILAVAADARGHCLGVFHPSFSLLRSLRHSLLQKLPADAHLRASGRLCVSLTRMRDGRNVLVSEFASRDELIQVLMCSCFFPVYCGYIPPSYRGELYLDGALSNNMPMVDRRNTVTIAPFSGESDICPREGTFNFFEANYGNVSIQVNTGNVHRVCTSFLPPTLQKLAEICDNGYRDALRFLTDTGLLPSPGTPPVSDTLGSSCCGSGLDSLASPEPEDGLDRHPWLPRRTIASLPAELKTVLCAACRGSHEARSRWSGLEDFLLVKALLLLLSPVALILDLIVDLTVFVTQSVLSSCWSGHQRETPCGSAEFPSESPTMTHRRPLTSVAACSRKVELLLTATPVSSVRANFRTGRRHRLAC
ncbi:patatin-like phospholipase domain-containing protein 2 [Synchiropus splendidus]|uniref:patatin-like phospholipase domain-containing protein 2 n=1 Tax=Synchiropus splendidus TaxID=270530 RepID=UPI00237D92F1|nr:patatin-like phospholipase domain-containing protein 2 [Synchiropus splendidus]